jgi:SAM-dependent methyltransferase
VAVEQVRAVRVTGERVVTPEAGFNPTWQRHVAAYAESARFLPAGTVLDVGCGVGHSYELLAPRETVGVDVAAEALAGQDRPTVVADMRDLPFAPDSFASALAVHSIEHVPDADRALRELTRVVEPGGVVVLVTPNRLTFGRPDEIIDPYHFVEYDPRELAALCEPHFAEVDLHGLFGSEAYGAIVDDERRVLDRALAADPLRLRRLVPRRVRMAGYDWALSRARRRPDARAASIGVADFALRSEGLDEALDLVAVCRVG